MNSDHIWQPDSTLKPFIEDNLNEELPADIQAFITKHQMESKFSLEIKAFNNELYQGRPRIVAEYADEIPKYDAVVRANGPAYYRWDFTFKPSHGKNKTEKIYTALVGPQWNRVWDKAEAERKEARKEKIVDEIKEQNILNALGNNKTQAPDPFAAAQKTMESAMGLINPVLDRIAPQQPGNGEGGSMAVMGQMMQGVFGMMMAQQQSNTQLILGLLSNKNDNQPQPGDQWEKAMNFMGNMFNFKQMLEPKEEGIIERIGGMVADNLDTLLQLFAMPPDQREKDLMYKKVAGDKRMGEVKEKVHKSENFARRLIEHLDKRAGAKMTDRLLEGFLKYTRPDDMKQDKDYQAATKENAPNEEGVQSEAA